MFNNYTLSTGPSHSYKKVKIDEHRAPTDDSVRLLSEMEEKAHRRVIEAVEVDNNTVTGMMMVMEPDYLHRKYKFYAKVVINGRPLIIEESINWEFHRKDNIGAMLRLLYKNVAEKIAQDLMDTVVHTEGFKHMIRSENGHNKNL